MTQMDFNFAVLNAYQYRDDAVAAASKMHTITDADKAEIFSQALRYVLNERPD